MFAILGLIISICINIPWIIDIACFFGYFLAIYLVTFIALIPGFNYVFTLISLICDKKEFKKSCSIKEEDVTILIPVYNVENSIKETIESIEMQKEIDCKLEKRSILAFIFYILLYAFILAPYCLIGYISELINCKKKW